MNHGIGWLGILAVVSAAVSAVILLTFLVRKPQIGADTKVWLLLGLGVLPIASAASANIQGFQSMESREFCGSCHVMIPHAADSDDPNSRSLAAIHARNRYFGEENCYTCHKDYGMYGFVLTKLGGLRHVYYYLTEYHDMPLSESKHDIRIVHPLPNDTCMGCHTTNAPRWNSVPDHASSLEEVRNGTISCASPGCHGFAHPVTKLGKELTMDGKPNPDFDAGAKHR